ncbi:MAG: hypothetical protein ACYTAN_06015 [Planctomycetota bacterium]|jgi:hypothetical protein
MVDKSDIFADDYWKEQWRAVVAREKTVDGEDVNVLTMAVQLARRWGPSFCPKCEPRAKKLLDLVDAAYKILSARREQMLADRKTSAERRPSAAAGRQAANPDIATLRVLEILEDIRDGLLNLGNNGHQ